MVVRVSAWALVGVLLASGCGRVVDDGAPPTGRPGASGPPRATPPSARSIEGRTKVDLLLAVDNSSGMGDKQAYLADAVPRLIERLLQPRCVDESAPAVVVGTSTVDDRGVATCPAGSKPELPALTDLHVAVVSSSLGGRGSDACTAGSGGHNDDGGHLIAREAAGGGAFLAWRPGADESRFAAHFAERVSAIGENGCGFEAQLESMYRFLIQPDPYATLEREGDRIVPRGVDDELLAERRAFLRPDSVVAVVMLTDEDESSVAPGAFDGRSWFFEDSKHVRPGTKACATDPDSPHCMSCFLKDAEGDPACGVVLDDTTDNINVRFFDMKRRFGVDPRYPVERYVRGLREPRVPSSDREWQGFDYVGGDPDHATCVNPLFADQLPEPGGDLCGLTVGSRTADDVVFMAIGGVPWQLLSSRPDDLSASAAGRTVKASLDATDWRRVLGDGPTHDGRHPLMQPSIVPRAGLGVDEAHGADVFMGNQLQFACMFRLPKPRDCSLPENVDACDCSPGGASPLCDPDRPDRQISARAVPTLRVLEVARALGAQGLVASACPIDGEPDVRGGEANPRYGYRPALDALAARLATTLSPRCLTAPFDDACAVVTPSDGRPCHDQGLLDPPPFVGGPSPACALPRAEGDCRAGRGYCVRDEGGVCRARIVTAPGTVRETAPLSLVCP